MGLAWTLLHHPQLDAAFKEVALTLPSEKFVAEQLNEVDVEGVEPMTSAVEGLSLPMREDVVTAGDDPQKVLKNAPKSEDGFFVVPKVVE